MLIGFDGSRMSKSQISLIAVLGVVEHRLVEHDQQVAVGQRQGSCGCRRRRAGDQLRWTMSFGVAAVGDVEHRRGPASRQAQ